MRRELKWVRSLHHISAYNNYILTMKQRSHRRAKQIVQQAPSQVAQMTHRNVYFKLNGPKLHHYVDLNYFNTSAMRYRNMQVPSTIIDKHWFCLKSHSKMHSGS